MNPALLRENDLCDKSGAGRAASDLSYWAGLALKVE